MKYRIQEPGTTISSLADSKKKRFFLTCDSKHTYFFLAWVYLVLLTKYVKSTITCICLEILILLNKRWQWQTIDFVCLMPLLTIFQLYCAFSFIGGGNLRIQRKPPTCCKSLTNFITYCCTSRPDRDLNSQHQWWKALVA